MARRLALAGLLALAGCGIGAQAVQAKGLELGGATGVALAGSPYRYVALSPNYPDFPGELTVVEQIHRYGGQLGRWWYLRGSWHLPAVAYDRSAGGLSADEGTLVLRRFTPNAYLQVPRTSRFAILNTRVHLRHPRRPGQDRPLHAVTRVALRGEYSFHAISPHGRTIYLSRYLVPGRPDAIEVRAFDVEEERLLHEPIAAPDGTAQMKGLPITRVADSRGRWSYTLYDGNGGAPFVYALDTAAGRAVRIDLPQLEGRRNPMMMRMRVERAGRELVVLSGPRVIPARPPRPGNPRPLLTVDTKSFEVREPTATISSWGLPAWLSKGAPSQAPPPKRGLLAFARTPRRPGNLLARRDVVGRSADGRPIALLQRGDPAIDGELLVFGCIHGDECAASEIEPLAGGCPDPASDVYLVRNLNPDGLAAGTRLNGRGVDLNRNFPAGWRASGARGDPEYPGPRPFSEPETRLAARIVDRLRPEVTIWFHQHWARRPLVRAFGKSVPEARRFAALARLPFRVMPWPAGTAPHWQNERFPGTSAFVVELPRGPLAAEMRNRLGRAVIRQARKVGED